MQSNQMLIKPIHSLQERLLLRKLLDLHTQIAPNRKTMHYAREEVDLIRLFCLNEDCLGLVAFLGGEDLVCFCGGDGEGAGDGGEFGFFDEAVPTHS
jgi:hypothetical protein